MVYGLRSDGPWNGVSEKGTAGLRHATGAAGTRSTSSIARTATANGTASTGASLGGARVSLRLFDDCVASIFTELVDVFRMANRLAERPVIDQLPRRLARRPGTCSGTAQIGDHELTGVVS